MLASSQVTADGITTGRFYEVKCFTKDENHLLVINNRLQMVAYPTSYFGILYEKERFMKMIREKTFPINNI